MNSLFEAFQALDLLNEETFELDQEGIAELKKFEDESDKEVEIFDIIDPEAETEEEIKDEYVGDAILQCTVCESMIYKKPDEVVLNEEETLANVAETCPYCQSNDGFKVIGQVAPFVKPSEEVEEEGEEVTEVEVDKEELTEAQSLKARMAKKSQKDPLDDIDADADDKKEKAKKQFAKAKDDADADRDEKKDKLEESDKPAATSIEDAQKWVDFDMKRYGKISERTNRLIKKAGFQILKDDHGDYEVAAGKFEGCEESLKEDFNKVDIETDREKMSMTADENGKVTVTTEPKSEEPEEETMVAVTDETKNEFKVEEPEEEYDDIDIDEFEEKDFDELGEKYMREVYDNVKSFKTSSVRSKGNTLKLEGLITFKSGKQAKTNFIFEAATVSKKGKIKFLGENKQFARGKKSFTLTGSMNGKKFIMESLTYNYKANDPKTQISKRLYGTVRVAR